MKFNVGVDKIHATLTVIQWQEIVKGVRFSILIPGTLAVDFLENAVEKVPLSKLERFTIYLFC